MYSILFSILWSSLVYAGGFKSGDQFVATKIYGDVTVFCSAPTPSTRFVNCDTEILDPGEYDYFKHDQETDATSVTLSNTIGNKTYSSTKKFNSTTGLSKKPFNLWVASLFQRPLLDYGANILTYKLSKDKQPIEVGTFNVTVTRGEERRCRPRTIHSSRSSDCEFGSQSVCYQYFHGENYCNY